MNQTIVEQLKSELRRTIKTGIHAGFLDSGNELVVVDNPSNTQFTVSVQQVESAALALHGKELERAKLLLAIGEYSDLTAYERRRRYAKTHPGLNTWEDARRTHVDHTLSLVSVEWNKRFSKAAVVAKSERPEYPFKFLLNEMVHTYPQQIPGVRTVRIKRVLQALENGVNHCELPYKAHQAGGIAPELELLSGNGVLSVTAKNPYVKDDSEGLVYLVRIDFAELQRGETVTLEWIERTTVNREAIVPLRQRTVFVDPHNPTDEVRITVNFGGIRPDPGTIWSYAGIPREMTDTSATEQKVLTLTEGQVSDRWEFPRMNNAYGIRWFWPASSSQYEGHSSS